MQNMQSPRATVVSLLLSLLLSACGGERQNDPVVVSQLTLEIAVQEAVDNNIVVAVDNFAFHAAGLEESAEAFCLVPDNAFLNDLQQAWRTLTESWYRLIPYNFGPLNDDIVFPPYIFVDSLRLRGTNYTGTVRSEIASNIAGTFALDEDYFAAQSFQKLGILALELAIFETSSNQSTSSEDIVAEYRSTQRKCDILLGLSEQLLQRAQYVRNGWNVAHKDSDEPYRSLFLNNMLDDGAEPITQLLSAAQEHLDYLQQRNVVTTTAQVSDYAWQLVTVSIDEIEKLLIGTENTSVSFFALMRSNGDEASVETVEANIAVARSSINSRDATLFGAAVAQLDGNFKREIPNGLEVELGIIFTDGD